MVRFLDLGGPMKTRAPESGLELGDTLVELGKKGSLVLSEVTTQGF